MNTIAIIYASKYGHTKQYAQWLAEDLSADIYTIKELNGSILHKYDTFIFGSGIYIGASKAASVIAKNFDRLQHKNVLLFTCGLFDITNETIVSKINQGLDGVLSPEMREKITVFHLRGGIDYAKLSFLYRFLMKAMYSNIMKKPENERTIEDFDFLSTYGKTIDFSSRASIEPIVEYCKSK